MLDIFVDKTQPWTNRSIRSLPQPQQGLESLFEQFTDHKHSTDNVKDKATLEKKRSAAEGDAIRRTAIGQYVPKPPDGVKDADFLIELGFGEDDGDGGENFEMSQLVRSRGPSKRKSVGSNSSSETLNSALASRAESRLQEAANKKHRLALLERQIEISEKQNEERAKERAEDRQAQAEARQAQAEARQEQKDAIETNQAFLKSMMDVMLVMASKK